MTILKPDRARLPCSDAKYGKCHNGYFDKDCKCNCFGFWSGSDCSTCQPSSIQCNNGGTVP